MIMENSAILKLKKPIVLVGMMGVGKTTYGKKVASLLKIPFEDVDHLIENDIGHSVSWVFENAGEAEFRKMEEHKIAEVLMENRCLILALGGGAFINENTRKLVKQKAVSIWLQTSPEVILKRVSIRKDRPLLQGEDDQLKKIKSILSSREEYYKQADIHVETDFSGQRDVAYKIIDAIENYLGVK